MYQIAYIGRWETLPETAAAICDHDTPKLEAMLQGGLDLDVPIQLSEYIKLMPLEIAVFRNDVPMIHFLLEHGADPDLAEEQPLLLTAARCCGPEVVALFAGQAAKLSSKQKERAFQEVRWGQRAENIQVLEQAGITVDKFVGEEYRIQVGNTDFFIDLLFYNRALSCLVAIELKVDKFRPEHLGQLNFYLEALDRDVRKPNENPSVGLILCTSKDDTVVEYALSRSMSPTMVADYTLHLPDKTLLENRLRELTQALTLESGDAE